MRITLATDLAAASAAVASVFAPRTAALTGSFVLAAEMLAGGQRFPTCAAHVAVAFFQNNQNTAHSTRTSNFSFSTRAAAASLAVPGRICVERCFWGRAMDSSAARAAAGGAQVRCRHAAHFLGLGALDAHQRGVAQLVSAGLDGEHRGQRQFDVLEPAAFELALYVEAGVGLLDGEDERSVRQAEQFGEDHAGLSEAEVVGLQAGQHQVGRFGLDGFGEQPRDRERIELMQVVGVHVDGAIGALGEGFANGGADALRAGGEDDHFAAVLFLELQRLLRARRRPIRSWRTARRLLQSICRPRRCAPAHRAPALA